MIYKILLWKQWNFEAAWSHRWRGPLFVPTWTNPVSGLMREGGTTVAAVDWVDLQRQDPDPE